MSLILDALTRAEQEKRQPEGAPPDLLSPAPTPAVASKGVNARLLVPLVVVVVLVGIAAWWLLRPDGGENATGAPSASLEPIASPVNSGATAPTPTPTPTSTPTATTAPSATGRLAAEEGAPNPSRRAMPWEQASTTAASTASVGLNADVRALYDRSSQSQRPSSAPESPQVSAAASREQPSRSQPVLASTATSASGADSEADNPQQSETPIDVEAVLRQVQRESRNAALEAHPVPFLADQSKQFRDSVPTLMYQGHDFRGDSASTVRINGTTLRPGQRSRGVELREILTDSVILRYNNTDFRLRALNSWVNL